MHKSLQAIIDDVLAAESKGDKSLGDLTSEDAGKYAEAIIAADMNGEFGRVGIGDPISDSLKRALTALDLLTNLRTSGRAF